MSKSVCTPPENVGQYSIFMEYWWLCDKFGSDQLTVDGSISYLNQSNIYKFLGKVPSLGFSES